MLSEEILERLEKRQEETLLLLKDCREKGPDNKDKLYDLTDLENVLKVSRRTLFKWKSEGKLHFSQIGKKLYITDEELKRFLVDNNLNNSDYGRK